MKGTDLMELNYFASFFKIIEDLIDDKIPEEEQVKVMKIFKPKMLKKKEMFLKAGDIPDCIAFNISGLLRCFYIDIKGNDVTKYFCFEDSIISYLGLIKKSESKYYIEAIEDCLLLCTDYSSFNELMSDSIWGLKVVKSLLEKSLLYKEERESSFLLETATERYVNFIKKYPNIEKQINLGYIASYLGVSQVSLSRIRNKLDRI
ncbi:MAG: Crp/Fnr family transcriptional regulator [Bacillota bacterium]|nr:Crp/Fnr family transcriptional regulator [Bacillota bacterium]